MSVMTSTNPFETTSDPGNPALGEPFDAQDDDLVVDFVFDRRTRRLVCVHTGGLWSAGIPELYIRPPQNFSTGAALLDAQLAVFLAGGLIGLGRALLAADDGEVPSHQGTLDGRRVQFWLGGPEPPFPRLAENLDADVDSVIRVDCSLWHTPLLGDG